MTGWLRRRPGWLAGLLWAGVVWPAPDAPAQTASRPAPPAARRNDQDMETIKRRLHDALLPTTPEGRRSLSEAAQRHRDTLGADGSWNDIDYQDQTRGPWKTSAHLSRVSAMATAYRTPAQELDGDPALRAAILRGLDFWLARDFKNPNWWHNEIGVPRMMGDILLLMETEMSPAALRHGVEIMKRSRTERMTGANLVWTAGIQLSRGLLEGSPAVAADALGKIFGEVRVAGIGHEGIQSDDSFHQHGACLYSGGYGAAFTSDTARFLTFARGTRFAIPEDKLTLLSRYVLDGQQWAVRGRVFDYGVTGREIVRAGKDARGLVRALDQFAALPGPRQAEFSAFARRLRGEPGAAPLTGNRHYWRSDFMTHHRPGYYTSARMFSTRTLNTDGFINGENRKSHHVADGATYIFRTGEEYRDIFPVWDWRRIPGTTCEQSPEPFVPEKVQTRGTTSFVGGVSDGDYGLAAMDLARGTLTARKAWFYFDDAFVCLGAEIACATDNPVLTSVNQCLLQGEVRVSDRPGALSSGNHALSTAGWVLHDGVGYLFPEPSRVHVRSAAQTGSWAEIGAGSSQKETKGVFSLWIDHGKRPEGGSYAYVVVPGTDAAALDARSKRGDIEILSNTPALQAVRHGGLRMLQAAFRQAGTLRAGGGGNVTVDRPCLLLLREQGDGVQIAVSNPENQPLTVQVDVDRRLTGEGCRARGDGGTRVTFVLPGGEEAGRSVVRLLREGERGTP